MLVTMKLTRFTIFIFCLLFPFLGLAQESFTKNEADQVFNQIPVKQTLIEMPEDLKSQFSQNPFGISPKRNSRLVELFTKAFDPDILADTARKEFHSQFDTTKAEDVLSALQSETLKQVVDKEFEYFTIQGIRKRIITKYELERDKPSEQRQALIKKIVNNKSAKDSEIESQKIIFRSFVVATSAISDNIRLSENQIEGIVGNFTNRMQMQLENELINTYLIMYHGLDDDQLTQYADFYASEAGRELRNAITTSINNAFQSASDRFLENVRSL